MTQQLNLPLQFRYNHLERPRLINDVRKKRLMKIQHEQAYFVGFRISAKTGDIYHHAMIVADDFDAFLEGIAGEYNAIMDLYLVTFLSAISLIFVRNLVMTDPDVIAAAEQHNITSEVKKCLSKRDDEMFTVTGMIGEHQIGMVQVAERDGLLATGQARTRIMKELGEEFMVLDVCQAHPIRHEFDAIFAKEAEQFKSLVDAKSVWSSPVQ